MRDQGERSYLLNLRTVLFATELCCPVYDYAGKAALSKGFWNPYLFQDYFLFSIRSFKNTAVYGDPFWWAIRSQSNIFPLELEHGEETTGIPLDKKVLTWLFRIKFPAPPRQSSNTKSPPAGRLFALNALLPGDGNGQVMVVCPGRGEGGGGGGGGEGWM